MTKFQLLTLLTSRNTQFTYGGETFYLIGVEREDGSGNCFNVRVRTEANTYKTFFLRTLD